MEQKEFETIVKACRFCLMCRHLCTVGNITYAESNTPRGHALILDCIGSEALEDNSKNRRRAAEVFFSCSYCGHCQNNCVSSYRHPDAIIKARSGIPEDDLPKKVAALHSTIEETGSIYDQPLQYEEKTVLTWSDIQGAEALLYFGSFARNEASDICDIAVSMLIKAGVSLTFMSKETDSGMDAYLAGMPDVYQYVLDEEIQKINDLEPKRLICLSPDDLRVFLGEVPDLSAERLKVPVVSFTAFLLELVLQRSLILKDASASAEIGFQNVSYHDSDQSGRFLKRYFEPRDLIQEVPDINFRELYWSKGESASAGESGLIRYLDKELAEKIALKRLDQIEGKTDIIVTDSATAKAQLQNAIYIRNSNLKVKHIAEFIYNFI